MLECALFCLMDRSNYGTSVILRSIGVCCFADVTTAAAAREALEGHCIYDGGYCKLHLSYSRHTDLNVKV